MERSIRIVLADDHPVVRIGVRNMLSKSDGFDVVGDATDGDDTVRLSLMSIHDGLQSGSS